MTVRRQTDDARYAIYWAPADRSRLAQIGNSWLGRDAVTDQPLARLAIDGFDDAMLAAVTAEPRRYGLHATLKPPFRLAESMSVAALEQELEAFAAAWSPVTVPSVELMLIGRFLALAPRRPAKAVGALARECVERFDRFRAPMLPEDLARRRAVGLSPAQEANLVKWGYPYVMDEYLFHVTLTGKLERAVSNRLRKPLAALFAPVTRSPLEIGEVGLFVEASSGAPFRVVRRFNLKAS